MINLGQPVNWAEPLNRGLAVWLLPLRVQRRSFFYDLTTKYHGTLSGTPTWGDGVPGMFDGIICDGIDDQVYLSSTINTICPTACTIAIWVKPNSTGVNRSYIGMTSAGVTPTEFGFQTYSGTFYAGFYSPGSPGQRASVAENLTTDWQQFTITYSNGGNTTLYRNGTQIAQQSGCSVLTCEYAISFGRELWVDSDWFGGRYGDIRIHTREMPADEVMRLYQQSRLGYPTALNRIRPVYGKAAAAGAASFKSAWARGSNVMILPGTL